MRSVWVNRDSSNRVTDLFGAEQHEGQEKLTDEHPDVKKFSRDSMLPPLEQARLEYPGYFELVEAFAEYRTGKPTKINRFTAKINSAHKKHGVKND